MEVMDMSKTLEKLEASKALEEQLIRVQKNIQQLEMDFSLSCLQYGGTKKVSKQYWEQGGCSPQETQLNELKKIENDLQKKLRKMMRG